MKRPVYRSGRHFLQIPGPTNVPDRVPRAIDGIPTRLSATPGTIRRPAPLLGQHPDEILAELRDE